MSNKLKIIAILAGSLLMSFPFPKCGPAEVKIGYGWSVNADEAKAVQEAVEMMRMTISKPNLVILLIESSYENDSIIAQNLYRLANKPKVYGLEGTYAVFSRDGVHVGEKGSLAILGIEAPSWSVGVGVMDMSNAETPTQIKEMALKAIKSAIDDAGKTTEDKPSLVFIAPTKLKEEPILSAIEYVFSNDVRIVGGSPGGPNTIANDRVVENGFVLAVIYADTKIGAGFHAGIAVDRNKSGVVTTMGETHRIIKEINNKPAFEVYRNWADGALDDVNVSESTSIWSRSFALVRVYNLAQNEVGTKVVVPITVNPDLSLVTGADISEGEHLYFATASKKAYIKRAGTIVQQALVEGKIKYPELVGGVHYYCRGAAFSQFGRDRENLQPLVNETNKKMNGKPYIGTFTAGEQGNISGYGIFMGNLTSSMAVFAE
ncbi:MAG: FIST C-terminal domain-containing protein [Deltaproteobacteria bacterium]|nr:FIST C-terminal domain-containing protein [Deltaproteobacteria bacterium]